MANHLVLRFSASKDRLPPAPERKTLRREEQCNKNKQQGQVRNHGGKGHILSGATWLGALGCPGAGGTV